MTIFIVHEKNVLGLQVRVDKRLPVEDWRYVNQMIDNGSSEVDLQATLFSSCLANDWI